MTRRVDPIRASVLLIGCAGAMACGTAAGGKSATGDTSSSSDSASASGGNGSSSGGSSSSATDGGSSNAGGTSSSGGASSSAETVSTSTGGTSFGAGGTSGGAATLEGDEILSCETYCMTDADCCAELGFGEQCPDRYPGRALCQIQPELGFDHVCRNINSACLDDAECQAVDPELICAENAPQWCGEMCPGLNTCLPQGCAEDGDCDAGHICIVRGRVGLCSRSCASNGDCDAGLYCQDNVYPEDPRAICIQQPNTGVPISDPIPPECATDADCSDSGNGPRCNASLGRCGCAGDADCSASERCR